MSTDLRGLRLLMVAACPFPTHGGTQVFIGQLAEALTAAGHRVDLLTYGLGSGDLRAHDEEVPYRVVRAAAVAGHDKLAAGPSWGRPVADGLLIARGLSEMVRAQRTGSAYDLIHAHNYEGALVGRALAGVFGTPLLYHAHNMMGDELETYFERRWLRAVAHRAGVLLDRTVPPLADATVSVSLATARRLRALADADRPIEYQPPAVDYGRSPTPARPGTPLIYNGNLDGYQGIDTLLRALCRRRTDALCQLLTGDVEHGQRAVARHGLGERVQVTAQTSFEQVKGQLEAAELGLLPRSVASGFPIKLINYLAAGLPVVACRGGAQGLDESAGVVVVDDEDDEAMAKAIDRLLGDDDLRRQLSERARAASATFTWPSHVRSLNQLYAQLLDWRHGTGASKETRDDVD